LRPGGTIVAVGLPVAPTPIDISTASTKEAWIETVFRYAHQYERSLALMASGRVDLKPLISETFAFEDSIKAFDRAVERDQTMSSFRSELSSGLPIPFRPDSVGRPSIAVQ
jgi:D-xylulose reductase